MQWLHHCEVKHRGVDGYQPLGMLQETRYGFYYGDKLGQSDVEQAARWLRMRDLVEEDVSRENLWYAVEDTNGLI
jgi:hypothetical protein